MTAITVETSKQIEVVDVTEPVLERLPRLPSGLAFVHTRHTTVGLLLCALDPGLREDLARVAGRLLAGCRPFVHLEEGNPNGEAHVLSALAGTQLTLPIVDGEAQLGRWQRLLLLELDGPRQRRVQVQGFGLAEAVRAEAAR